MPAPPVDPAPALCDALGRPVFDGTVAFPLIEGNPELADAITVCTIVLRGTVLVALVAIGAGKDEASEVISDEDGTPVDVEGRIVTNVPVLVFVLVVVLFPSFWRRERVPALLLVWHQILCSCTGLVAMRAG